MTTQRFDPLPARDRQAVIAQVINGFLAGDPIWSIAKAANMSSWETMNLLSTRIAERGEEERSKALRRRCSVVAEDLYQNEERIWQLLDAGIEGKDIPKVLAALGVSLDSEVATDLLRSPDMFMDIHSAIEVVVLPLPTDIFSLLYVVGRFRRLEPDYKFALGKVPMAGIDELRRVLVRRSSEAQLAEIVAMVETTAQAIRTGDVAGISYSDYADTVTVLAQESSAAGSRSWLVSAPNLRNGLGGGFWSKALEAAGLTLPSTAARFTRADYEGASKAFFTAYRDFGSPKDVASYDSWVTAEAAAGRDRPSLIAIRRYFGAWESVIGAVMPSEVEGEFDGMVEILKKESILEHRWARAGELVGDALADMPWNSFLSIDYGAEADGPRRPYAQASPSADGVWCEIVSEKFLPAEEWPINEAYLLRNGWSAPDDEVPNWHKQGIPPFEAGHQILEGLAYGRNCPDPQKVRWHSAEFPGGPGPDGGVILDYEPGGVVRNLRRAS
jgi:hypothetical protein